MSKKALPIAPHLRHGNTKEKKAVAHGERDTDARNYACAITAKLQMRSWSSTFERGEGESVRSNILTSRIDVIGSNLPLEREWYRATPRLQWRDRPGFAPGSWARTVSPYFLSAVRTCDDPGARVSLWPRLRTDLHESMYIRKV